MNEKFNSNPNQRKITVNKELTNDEDVKNYYAKINLIALKNAMHSLTPKAFELWIYLAKNQDRHTFYLSKVDFLNWGNVKAKSYYNAFDELVACDYLIPFDNNKYNFYEMPIEQNEIEITINKFENSENFLY